MRQMTVLLALLALAAACGTDDGLSTSESELRRTYCPMIYDPVCGKDGKTYSNECMAGGPQRVAYHGECKDPCAAVLCIEGTTCEVRGKKPVCVRSGKTDFCAAARCPAGTTCVNGPTGAECVPDSDPCAAVRCSAGTVCKVTEIWCITTPCDPIVECVPAECTPEECGPAPMMPNTLCSDGVTVAGPTGVCSRNADGACAWEIAQCP